MVKVDCGGRVGFVESQCTPASFVSGPARITSVRVRSTLRNQSSRPRPGLLSSGFCPSPTLVLPSRPQQECITTRCQWGRGGKCGALAVASAYPPIAKTERTFRLPIDYYQVLGAETHNLADAIVRAFEARVSSPPREGFSQQALLARLEILRGARDTLSDPDLRGEYNQGLLDDEAGTLVLEVPWTKVGGALCLLHEVGEVEVVLQAGQALLGQQQDLPKTLHRDVVLAMGLSYVELSREAMAETPPAVVKSCSHLESALKLLQEEGGTSLASDLQEQIEGTLEELTARCVLELLALPLDKDHEVQRQQGLQGVRSLLWGVDEGGDLAALGGFTHEQFMKEAFAQMTASEQVDLFTATPSNIPAESSEVYAVALAHVAEGFSGKRPQLIQEADALFLQLQQTNASLPDNEPSSRNLEFALERGMCALLLGEVDACRSWLGVEDESSPLRDPVVLDFIYSHSEESGERDALAGLCKLLESWLADVVFPTFRDTESLRVSLGGYYDDQSVLTYLEGLEKGGSSPLAAAAAIVRIGAGAGAALDSVKATLQRVFPLGRVKETVTYANELPKRDFSQFVSHKGTDGDALGPGPVLPGAIGFLSESAGDSWEHSDEGNNGAMSSGEIGNTRKPSARRGLAPVQIACTGVVFGALVVAGLRFLPLHPRFAHLLNVPTASVASSGVGKKEAVSEEVPKMDARLAEYMVRKWQSAKAHALGATHSVAQLPEVLEGQMLKSWTDRVNDVARHGWFWEYKLVGLNIDSVIVSDDGRRAMVEATLQEAARLFDGKHPEQDDSYRSTYTTRYELCHGDTGWRITGGAVLRT